MQPRGPDMSAYMQYGYGGLVDICLLDGRQYRSPQACGHGRFPPCPEMLAPERTMLGAAQETWLETALASSRKPWNLLAQQTVFAAMDQLIGPEIGYWTDAWSGYPAARARLVDFIAERDIPNPVILSGDIHAFLVNDVHARPGDPDSSVVATEIVTSSITSGGGRQETMDAWKAENPNIRFANNEQRGYTRLAVTAESLEADLIAVDDVADPDSGTHVLSSWHVLDGEPGAVT
jgi:alkaline phosphatase D